jgi:hypothetical protein
VSAAIRAFLSPRIPFIDPWYIIEALKKLRGKVHRLEQLGSLSKAVKTP